MYSSRDSPGLYFRDIVVNTNANVKLFADDTTLCLIVDDPNVTATILDNDLETIHKRAETWLVKFNSFNRLDLFFAFVRKKYHKPTSTS